jgi:hypothetical protein
MTATTTRHWTDYQVGQRVYADFHYRGKRELTVLSVGRKYVRFEKQDNNVVAEKGSKDIYLQGWGSIGTLYESEEAYHQDQAMRKLRDAISRYSNWRSLPDENIEAIAEILEIES